LREENTAPQVTDEAGREDKRIRVKSLMEEIRARTSEEIESSRDERLSYRSHRGDFHKQRKAGEILHSEELRFLNEHYHYGTSYRLEEIVSHRKGILGKVIVKLKRRFAHFIREGILKSYFEQEKEFQSRLVRLLNTQAKYIDERDASNFWELVHKVDVDVTKAVDRAERLQDEFIAEHRSADRRMHDSMHRELTTMAEQVADLRAEVAQQNAALGTVEKVVHGLESITARLARSSSPESTSSSHDESVEPRTESSQDQTATSSENSGIDYLLLENRFRGSEKEIEERLSQYVELFRGVPGEVLDIGCGRGELLSLLREDGIAARGVDLDKGMITVAQERGLNVSLGCGIEALRNTPSETLGGIIAIQVIEHLPPAVVQELVREAHERLAPGGKLILETINPKSLLALSSNYFRDPTHVFPQHPDTLAHICTTTGFGEANIRYLSPVPEEALLKRVGKEDYMTPRWQFMLDRMNNNIDRLNDLLYGYQDFAVIATK
jgi:2-polyprenyl-3-methyl-5-hydroxy-6-metoxy-1,4-benzoquinol methylase